MEKIVLIGAGSAMFTQGLVADLVDKGLEAELALVDVDPSALHVADRLVRKMLALRGSNIKVSTSTDRRDVLRDATVVICTVGVGGRRAWEQDVYIPRRYGIYQPVGDTSMPGGSSRALRMIPAMIDVARDVMDIAPKAFFFNYGNPMSPTCRGIIKATGANVIGLCNGVTHVAGYLARAMDVPEREFDYTAVGINHLTWFLKLNRRGVDLMPRFAQLAEARKNLPISRRMAMGFLTKPEDETPEYPPSEDNPFSWQLARLFGSFPSAMDRHTTEFFPQFFADGSYFGKTLGKDAFSFEGVIAHGDEEYGRMVEAAESRDPLPESFLQRSAGEHQQVLDIIESIRTDAGKIFSFNLSNKGQVSNLPQNAVIECPGRADRSGIHPLPVGKIPDALAGLLASRFAWVESIVEAAIEGSREKFIQALVLDGSISNIDQTVALADDLLQAQAAYLPQFDRVVEKRVALSPALEKARVNTVRKSLV